VLGIAAKPKLLIVENTLETFGGGERWAMETTTMLDGIMDITILNPVSPNDVKRVTIAELRRKYKGNYAIIDVPCASRQVRKGNFLMMFPTLTGLSRLKNAIRDADVVYELSMNPFILANAILFSKLYRKRLILDMGNPLLLREDRLKELRQSTLSRLLQRLLLLMVGELHVQTESQMRMVRKYGYSGKTYYIPHYAYLKPGKPASRPKGSRFRVLFVGRLDIWQKGVDLLCNVINSALQEDQELMFDLVGSGEGKNKLHDLAMRHKENVRYHGFVPDRTLGRLYQQADLFIITSRYETPGLALLEAQTYGLPAIGFDVQGPSDIIQEDVQGKLIKPFDSQKFAEAIISESRRKGASASRREKIIRLIGRKYSPEMFVKRFTEMVAKDKV
jgi:glycosyltransferase involved in cell wall biosynthesis